MSEFKQITSIQRYKVGRDLSHPVGAQAISRLLTDVPQFDELRIIFSWEPGIELGSSQPGWTDRPLKGVRTHFGFHEVLKIHYQLQCGWEVWVSPVKRTDKFRIQTCICEIGLPEAANWLAQSRPETWFEGRRVLQLGIDENSTELCFLETHNQWVVDSRIVSLR